MKTSEDPVMGDLVKICITKEEQMSLYKGARSIQLLLPATCHTLLTLLIYNIWFLQSSRPLICSKKILSLVICTCFNRYTDVKCSDASLIRKLERLYSKYHKVLKILCSIDRNTHRISLQSL